MKNLYQNFKQFLAICVLLISHSAIAQNPYSTKGVTLEEVGGWEPIKFTENETSGIIRGVKFSTKNVSCNSQSVIIMQLINTNDFDVKISYKLSEEESPKIIVLLAHKTLEGSCEELIQSGLLSNKVTEKFEEQVLYFKKSVSVL